MKKRKPDEAPTMILIITIIITWLTLLWAMWYRLRVIELVCRRG